MPIVKEKKFGGESFIGYKTLFVNSKETQRLSQKQGLPPVAPLKAANDFHNTSPGPPVNLTNPDILSSDLLRYNLGKFFWRNPKQQDPINYKFVEPSIHFNTAPIPSYEEGGNIWSRFNFYPSTRFQIGFDADYQNIQSPAFEVVSLSEDLENLKFSSKTFVILSFDPNSYSGTILKFGLKASYPFVEYQGNPTPMELLWNYYLSYGADGASGISPQYLGLGQHLLNDASDAPSLDKLPSYFKYSDHAFSFAHPYGLNKRDDLGSVNVFYADVEASYIFHQEIYEKGLGYLRDAEQAAGILTELYLPNFNVILEETKTLVTETQIDLGLAMAVEKEAITTNHNYLIHSTLNGRVPINILRPLETQNKKYDEVNGRSGNQYLDEWGSVIMKSPTQVFEDVDLQNTAQKFRNVIYPLNALKDNDINISKASFPFYNEINFNTDTSNKMADILRNSKLFDALVLDYINQMNIAGMRTQDIDFHSYQELLLSVAAASEGKKTSFNEQFLPLNESGNKYKTYNFDAFAMQIKNLNSTNSLMQSISAAQAATISVSGEDFSDENIDLFQADPLSQLIYKMTFLSTYASFVKENLRTYRDIVQGVLAYNETLFYRIEKRNNQGNVIQNFYVLNDSELDEVNLIDTQIKYGVDYTYQIFAVQFVVGNDYHYEKGPSAPESAFIEGTNPYKFVDPAEEEYFFNLFAATSQSVRLIEVPYVQPAAVRVQEAPPVPPNINFVPYRGIDNQILITFNTGVDEYYDKYIPILPHDADLIEQTSIVNSKGQTLFKSEGDATSFEMFRISERQMPDGPKSYLDFGMPNLTKRVTLTRDFGDPTYTDNIIPNTKYWYTFRTNDAKHSIEDLAPDFSNPTVVYEIQLINNEGAVYLILNTYDVSFFNQQKLILEKQKTRSMRKYLHLQPSFDQTILNTDVTDFYKPAILPSMKKYVEEDLNENVSNIKLGYSKESVFGNLDETTNNKFKVRLTSKKTGRKIDIFLRFKKPTLEK